MWYNKNRDYAEDEFCMNYGSWSTSYKKHLPRLITRIAAAAVLVIAAAMLCSCYNLQNTKSSQNGNTSTQNAVNSSVHPTQVVSTVSGSSPTQSVQSQNSQAQETMVIMYGGDDGVYALTSAGKKLEISSKYHFNVDSYSSRDGSVIAAFLQGDAYEDYSLFIIKNNTVTNITEGQHLAEFMLSDDGSKLAYMTQEVSGKVYNSLYLYDCQSGERELISQFASSECPIIMAPDGSALSYQAYNENDKVAYVKVGKKEPEQLGKDIQVVALSSNAEFCYYFKLNPRDFYYPSGYYLAQNGNEIELASLSRKGNKNFFYYFNADRTQCLFTDGSQTSLANNGVKTDVVSGALGAVLSPSLWSYINVETNFYMAPTLLPTLTGHVFTASPGDVYYLDKAGKANLIVSGTQSRGLSIDGSMLYFLKDGMLCRTPVSGGDTVELAQDVSAFRVSPSGSTIFYINNDTDKNEIRQNGGLFLIKDLDSEPSKPIKITDNALFELEGFSSDGKQFYFSKDWDAPSDTGTLYRVDENGNMVKISKAVRVRSTQYPWVIYGTETSKKTHIRDYYISTDGITFKHFAIAEGLEMP